MANLLTKCNLDSSDAGQGVFLCSCEHGNETSRLSKRVAFTEDKPVTNILYCVISYSPTILTELSCSPVLTFITDSYTLSTRGMIVTTAVGATVYASPAQITFTSIVRCTHTVAMDTLVVTPVHQIRMCHIKTGIELCVCVGGGGGGKNTKKFGGGCFLEKKKKKKKKQIFFFFVT